MKLAKQIPPPPLSPPYSSPTPTTTAIVIVTKYEARFKSPRRRFFFIIEFLFPFFLDTHIYLPAVLLRRGLGRRSTCSPKKRQTPLCSTFFFFFFYMGVSLLCSANPNPASTLTHTPPLFFIWPLLWICRAHIPTQIPINTHIIPKKIQIKNNKVYPLHPHFLLCSTHTHTRPSTALYFLQQHCPPTSVGQACSRFFHRCGRRKKCPPMRLHSRVCPSLGPLRIFFGGVLRCDASYTDAASTRT